jgi:esterase/lipase superfamily enzyme
MFLSDELPRFVRSVFPLSDKRSDNYVAGLSMGEYDAFNMALNKPEQFAAGITIPCLYMACGLDDELYEMSIKFRNFAKSYSVDLA